MASKAEIDAFLARDFPQTRCTVIDVGHRAATIRQAVGEEDLRPGATVSGPTLMGIADVALYIAVLGEIGIVPLAVTTNFSINFFKKPAPDRAIIGICGLLKVGRSLIVGEVKLYSEGHADVIAHAVATYSVPKTPAAV